MRPCVLRCGMFLRCGIALVRLGVLLYSLALKGSVNGHHVIDCKEICWIWWALIFISYCEVAFRNTNNLASHKVASYNQLHWLSQFGNLRMSPPPSSFGGLNPNRSFGFFFVHDAAVLSVVSDGWQRCVALQIAR
jgi:hypothetical protein